MAQDPKVTVKFDILPLIENFLDSAAANEIGNTVVASAKQMISEGQSPVRGYGRFEAYKNPKKYPGKKKLARPVNLNLTGDMLAAYGFKQKNSTTLTIGMIDGGKENEIAGYHNDGTENMAQRKLVPGQDEEWAVSVMRDIADAYGKRLADLIKLSNKKG